MSREDPQRLATWILTHCIPEARRDSLIGDLIEQYKDRGVWWYWRQTVSAVRTHTVSLLLAATETKVPAAEYIGDMIMGIALSIFAAMQLLIYAGLLIAWTRLKPSESCITVVSAMIGATVIGAVTVAREVRIKRGIVQP